MDFKNLIKKKGENEMQLNSKLTRNEEQSGITLIALVVTIVVLLILAGVSINALFGNSGIIEKAKDAQNRMNNAQESDLNALNDLDKWINNQVNGTTGGGTTGGDDNPPTSDLPSVANETTPYYPDETFTKDPDTNLDNGLVIKDSIGNEYVWIEVPKSLYANSSYNTETTTGDQKPSSSTDYDKIEYCLHKYTDYYRRNKSGTLTSYTDTYSSDAAAGLTETQYTELKQKMLKSVYENGGFWIGRYEAGITTNRTSKDEEITAAPLSKAGTVENAVYPYTYVTCSQAQTIASKLSTGKSYTSSLMFGVQWDLVLKHIEVKEVAKGTALATIQSALRSDSTSLGNYYNASFEINRGKYAKYGALTTWYNYNNESGLANCVTYANGTSTKVSASSSNAILLTTGASDECKKMNIYDLAGNVWEWTLEYTANTLSPCAIRGGRYFFNGSNYTASRRDGNDTTYSGNSIGFRPSLYK